MDGRKEGKAGLRIDYGNQQKTWLLNGWVDKWMGGIKLNYNGGPFSKMVRFL
jgi:hypothetical protein